MIESRDELERNIGDVRARIDAATKRVGRDASDVTLIAITKAVSTELVSWAAQAGVSDFGGNYVKEFAEHRAAAPNARWHFVGTLQSHTAHKVADEADVVHSAVPGRALRRLAIRATSLGKTLPVLLQVDETERRNGVAPEDAALALVEIEDIDGCDAIGLMTLPPEPEDPEDSRPHFRRLRALRDDLRKRFPEVVELSMGMSLDYEIAVEEGASMVRVGTALFGVRPLAPET